jgi:transcriptional regulator with XRE-family HTH domain
MLPVELKTPREIARTLSQRVRTLRLDRAWTQKEAAERAGIALATYQRFERTGRISLERLLKLAVIYDAVAGFEHLFAVAPARSLAELERLDRPARKRGKRSDAHA